MDSKPTEWSGTYDDQVELFVEILAYLLAREIMDENHTCMSKKSFIRIGRRLIKHEHYYEKSIEHFDKMLTTWGIEYKSATGIRCVANSEKFLSKGYRARLAARCPNGKHKKYAAVYEELE
jgi:hypothetical protein